MWRKLDLKMQSKLVEERANFIRDFSYRRDEVLAKELLADILQALSYAHQSGYQKLIVLTNASERVTRLLSRKVDLKQALKSLSVQTIDVLFIDQVDRVKLEVELCQSITPILVVESILSGIEKQVIEV